MLPPKQILEKIRCPACKGTLIPVNGESALSCENCQLIYPITECVPILLQPSRAAQIQDDISSWQKQAIIPSFIGYKTLQRIKSPAPFKWFDRRQVLGKIYNGLKDDGFYINIGAGQVRLTSAIYNLDISYSSYTDIVCDGESLPFDDNSVDGAFILLVLEHVPNPFRIVQEIHRVLKQNGFIVATIPFLQVLHENPRDYYRFTPDGFRVLFKEFNERQLTVAAGPTATLIWILKEYLALLCPFSNRPIIYASIRELMGWILYPLIVLDLYLNRKKLAYKMASFYFYHGVK